MKYTTWVCLLATFIFCLTTIVNAQNSDKNEPKWNISTGFGHYDTQTANGSGNIFYSEIGYRLSTGYNVGVGFGLSDVFSEYSQLDSMLEGERIYVNYYLYRLFIKRAFELGPNSNNQIKIGSGFLVVQPRFSYPTITSRGLEIFESTSNSIEAGFPFTLEYSYSFGALSIGVRAETHYLYGIGFEGYVLSPQLSIGF